MKSGAERDSKRNKNSRSTRKDRISLQLRLPLSQGWSGISGPWFWSMCGCVWKYSTVWEESRAIWQVLNLLAPTKEMPASGIHHCVLYTYTHTHAHIHICYLYSFSAKVLQVLVHIITCFTYACMTSPHALTSKSKFYNWLYLVNG